MRNKALRPRFWLVLVWRAVARLVTRTPQGHPLRPYLHAAGMAAENRYWRQARLRLRSRG